MTWKSPIEVTYGRLITETEKSILRAVQKCGVDVDREELIKALQYDRAQYEKGYEDAKAEIIRCKDCKHSEHWYRDKHRCFLWAEDGIDVFDDGFCNYAERRQDGGESK